VIVYVIDVASSGIYRSSDSGTSFVNLGAQFSVGAREVACSSDGVIVYVVDTVSDSIYRSSDSGVSFTDLGQQAGNGPYAVDCSSDGATVYILDNVTDSIYRSDDDGVSFTDLGAQFSTDPSGLACSSDGTVVYVTDLASDSIYLSTPASGEGAIPKGSINGLPVPVARDPFNYLWDGVTPRRYRGAGHELAYCGGDECYSGGQVDNPAGYLLVNKVGGAVYMIPPDPTKYPYFLYIGGQDFPAQANVQAARRDEFEDLCLKICPAQQWLGILVTYN
jgi:hypothetical protein